MAKALSIGWFPELIDEMTEYCYVKLHRESGETIVAICDENLLGRVIEYRGIRIRIDREFYGGIKVPVESIHEYIAMGSVVNLIGNNVVREAAKKNKLLLDAAIDLNGILHVQIINVYKW